MRDGTVLHDRRLPAGRPTGRYPVLLQRTPYNKELTGLALVQTDTFRAVRRGYAVVIQDCRGRYRSDGDFNPFLQEINDGYDAVEWCGSQPWSDGNVGMYGTSYVGATQWLAAIAAPPSLRAIVPAFTASDYYEGWTYQGGAFQWGFMCNWVLPFLTTADLLRRNAREGVADFEAVAQTGSSTPSTARTRRPRPLPLTDIPVNTEWTPYFFEWMAHPSRDSFWQERSIEERHDQVRVPGAQHRRLVRHLPRWLAAQLHRGAGAGRHRRGAQRQPPPARSLDAHHAAARQVGLGRFRRPGRAEPDAVEHGRRRGDAALLRPLAEGDRRRARRRAAGAALRHGRGRLARARTSGRWRARWRPTSSSAAAATPTRSAGDGALVARTRRATTGRTSSSTTRSTPCRPSAGNSAATRPPSTPAPSTSAPVEARPDVLVYTTPPLEQDMEVTGPVRLHLWAATTAPDTDFTAKLVDVYPDGYARNLTDGIIRARYRQGTDSPAPSPPASRLRVRDRPLGDEQPLPQGAPHRPGGQQQQLPALRPQPQHRPRAGRGRGDAAGGADDVSRSRSGRRGWCCRSCRGRAELSIFRKRSLRIGIFVCLRIRPV